MDELKPFESMWTTQRKMYYVEILDGDFGIMYKDNMMVIIEDNDIYLKVIRTMIQNNVEVIKYDPETKDKSIVSSSEALQEFDSIPRKDVNVKIIWEQDISISKQLINLKKVCEQISQIPTAQLFKTISKENREWVFAKMGYKQAMELLDKAQAEGIKLEIEV